MLGRRVARLARLTRLCTRGLSVAPEAAVPLEDLVIERTATPKTKLPNDKLVFGRTFTDHMVEVDWNPDKGWHSPRISPYHKLEIDPAASVLHYALECFEGMKAYVDDAGEARLFRPNMNITRMRNSMHRLSFPDIDPAGLHGLIEALVDVERDWIPHDDGFSLYLRPTAISTHPFLGVGASSAVKLFVIASPVGPYYPEGFKPVSLYADMAHVRAWPGGTGAAKIGSNYAPTIRPQQLAAGRGFSQVLWLFGHEDGGAVTEVGTMNMFVLWENDDGDLELITPPLGDGTILPGVTRDSILALAREWGEFQVSERVFSMGQLYRAVRAGRVREAFGAGTAAVVSPIAKIHWDGKDLDIPVEEALGAGPVTHRVWNEITDIQYGRTPHPWSVVVERKH